LLDIIEAEGPVVVLRSYQIYAKSAGISRVGKAVRSALNSAFAIGVRQKAIEIEDELGNGGQVKSVARIPDTPAVVLRTLGDRTLEEVPPSEIAQVMKMFESEKPIADKDDLFREVLNHFGLRRMTASTINFLERVFQKYNADVMN
jgi:hypothetical protein